MSGPSVAPATTFVSMATAVVARATGGTESALRVTGVRAG